MNRFLRALHGGLDALPHYTRIVYFLALEQVSTLWCRMVARICGVSLGAAAEFVGCAHISRARASRITIGKGARLLSAPRSNRHGLNRRCEISTLAPGAEIVIGDGFGGSGVVICAATKVIIGDRVMIGANSTITDTDSHPIHFADRHPLAHGQPAEYAYSKTVSAPVVIEDDVFIGMHTLILKGVRIGRGAVIGAGSVVVKDIPAETIAAGNPARPLRKVSEQDRRAASSAAI